MIAILVRVGALVAVYLLTLTSTAPGDALLGVLLAAPLVAIGWRRDRANRRPPRPPGTSAATRLAGVPGLVGGTLVDVAHASWAVVRFCVAPHRAAPGLVTMPMPCADARSAAAWGIRVGLAPDTVVVEADDGRAELVLHVIDASDPGEVRRAQLASYERRQRRVFP